MFLNMDSVSSTVAGIEGSLFPEPFKGALIFHECFECFQEFLWLGHLSDAPSLNSLRNLAGECARPNQATAHICDP